MKRARWIAACLVLTWGGSVAAVEPTGTSVEYFNTTLRHYFMTASPEDMRIVEAGGAGPGWIRTGGQFGVFASAADAPSLSPVCRFYAPGPNSHFYTPNAADCEAVKHMAGWNYEGIAFYIEQSSGGQCPAGTTPVYRSYNNGYARNDSNHRFTVDATVSAKSELSGYSFESISMCAPLSSADVQSDAMRLLRQASFGPTETEVARAAGMGATAWIDQQLAMPGTRYPDYPWVPANRDASCVDNRTQPVTAASYCARDNYTLFQLQLQFFRNALTQPDQLRGRVAFA